MKLKLILTTAIVGVALALPGVSDAAPPAPTFQDSVVLTSAPAVVPAPIFDSTIFALNATSGPSGENPSGLVRFDTVRGVFPLGGPVTCLAVNGNTATIGFTNQMGIFFIGDKFTVEVVDDQPDTWAYVVARVAPTDCSPLSGTPEVDFHRGPLSSGDFTVVDAQPPPTTNDQCKDGGWKQFGFKNQGQCIAFVNHGA
jgi:hypothetical protein